MFSDRREAGIKLASLLLKEKGLENSLIVSIPRGGTVVGAAISEVLQIPHSALIVKKIGAPHNAELAIGATGSDGVVYWDDELFSSLGINEDEKKKLLSETVQIIKEKEKSLGIKLPEVAGRTTILVDDGVATGATAIAASLILRDLGSNKIILATPVIAKYTKKELGKYFDKIITAELPHDFRAVGEFYHNFPQVEDKQVRKLLK